MVYPNVSPRPGKTRDGFDKARMEIRPEKASSLRKELPTTVQHDAAVAGGYLGP